MSPTVQNKSNVISDEDIYTKIKEAMLTHADGIVSEVMYDVKEEDVYIATRASTSSWEQDEDGYCPYAILTLQSYTGVFEICAMLNYDLQYSRDENPAEYKKDNDKFDNKCLKEATEYDETEWDIYQEIEEAIEAARESYKAHIFIEPAIQATTSPKEVFINKYIGAGIKDVITPQEIQEHYNNKADFGLDKIGGLWHQSYDHPSATKGTIAEADVVIEFSHDIDLENDDEGTRQFDEDGYTVSDMIQEQIRMWEERNEAEE